MSNEENIKEKLENYAKEGFDKAGNELEVLNGAICSSDAFFPNNG